MIFTLRSLLIGCCKQLHRWRPYLGAHIFWGRSPESLSAIGANGALVFFPYRPTLLACGLAGIVAFRPPRQSDETGSVDALLERLNACCLPSNDGDRPPGGGGNDLEQLRTSVQGLRLENAFVGLFTHPQRQKVLARHASNLQTRVDREAQWLSAHAGSLDSHTARSLSAQIEQLRDLQWCLKAEIGTNLNRVADLMGNHRPTGRVAITVYRRLNAVLNSLDRLEVRGRDSAGISIMFTLEADEYQRFRQAVDEQGLEEGFRQRLQQPLLVNASIGRRVFNHNDGDRVALTLTYKLAAEIGRLGDNVSFLRAQIRQDTILRLLAQTPASHHSICAHTRWASVGAISEANCHPVDSQHEGGPDPDDGLIHACLNGDIDNYLVLKEALARQGRSIAPAITTDTKIIPLQIDSYIRRGVSVTEAFRLAVNDFQGSHAIAMHTALAPGKLFLAQRGSGQSIYVGLGSDLFMPTSEVYGFIEETSCFVKIDGECRGTGSEGESQGQIFVLDQAAAGTLNGIQAMSYDGTPVTLTEADIKTTEITSRDIDRQQFPHYFLKEISEAPASVEKTLQNRWHAIPGDASRYAVRLDEKSIPLSLRDALGRKQIRRVFFMGQGTAGVAALACANILNYYLNDPGIYISALKSSELSGFNLQGQAAGQDMADVLVVAISQSGTTTDTNRTVDLVSERGAHTLAIVNRRDSDITFKVDGVVYTSSGRDIEMSVASTKAFYSQIVAGALVSLCIAGLSRNLPADVESTEIKKLLALPAQMRAVLNGQERIAASARKLAATKTYWAAVGSGPNKASADEIRIKLSELCYKTISSDFVEDKKHIDLSSEPLIIVCAAGTRATVIGDIVKDTAIFQAHKAVPVVIADEGEERFAPYARDVFQVPAVDEHLAPILNTLVGHIWGYYAALAINQGAQMLYDFRKELQGTIETHAQQGLDVYELVLEKSFREKIVRFYNDFRSIKIEQAFPTAIAKASDLILLLKYLAGKLPLSDFELDFGKTGTARNMLDTFFQFMDESINSMARPVDAIKHQAKTVTVGTSRIQEKLEGLLFDTLQANRFSPAQLINPNILVLKHLQAVVARVKGAILYRIDGLNLLGEPTEETTIEVLHKSGVLAELPSRVETDNRLKGTKRIIVRQGNVYISKGRKDDRSILVIPIISGDRAAPNRINHLLLLNVGFKDNISLEDKIKALGGKFEHIQNIVQENSIIWQDRHLEQVSTEELFGRSAEKIGEQIVRQLTRA